MANKTNKNSPLKNQSIGKYLKFIPGMGALGAIGLGLSALTNEDETLMSQYGPGTGGFGDYYDRNRGGTYNLFSSGMQDLISDFQGMDTSNLAADTYNPFSGMQNQLKAANIQNPYANIRNPYADVDLNIENVYEDLTVNQTAANIAAEQGAQARADALQAAGGNLTPAMAQMLSNQQVEQTQRIVSSIGEQESANQRLAAQGAADVQRQQKDLQMAAAQGEFEVEKMKATGEFQADQANLAQQNLVAQSQMSLDMAQAQGAMTQQQMIQAGAADARALEYQKQQGLMSLLASAEQAYQQNYQASRSWWERTFG
tara:strand:+ start:2511 stop:3452 length:942 start_codon:yes stop_codon:yes gene_type:complete